MINIRRLIKDPAVVLDYFRRRKIVGSADNQHSFQPKHLCFVKHVPQRPGRQTAPTSRWPNAVSDVTHAGHEVGELMAQRDSAKQLITLNDPSIGAMFVVCANRHGQVGLINEPPDPNGEPFRSFDLVLIAETKTVLVLAWPPLTMRLKPGFVETGGWRDQLRHPATLTVSP